MPKTKNRRDGKNRLLKAASALFAEKSYPEVGIAEILLASQVQAPSLYHHFEDKEGLYTACCESSFAVLKSVANAVINERSDPIDSLIGLSRTLGSQTSIDILRTLDQTDRLIRVENRQRVRLAFHEAVYEPVCIALMSAQDAGRLSIDGIESAASNFLSGALAVAQQSKLPVSAAEDGYRWHVMRFIYGFVRPLP